MIRAEKLKAEHLKILSQDPSVGPASECFTEASFQEAEACPHTFTVLDDNTPIACGGVREYWPGRGEAWAILSKESGRHMLAIHRIVRRFFEVCPVERIEAGVECGFEAGHRWIRLLGFELEAPLLRKFFVGGRDASLYARVK